MSGTDLAHGTALAVWSLCTAASQHAVKAAEKSERPATNARVARAGSVAVSSAVVASWIWAKVNTPSLPTLPAPAPVPTPTPQPAPAPVPVSNATLAVSIVALAAIGGAWWMLEASEPALSTAR